MAYSSSVKHAQTIKICELCQEASIKWRCIDCDKCLCGKCKTSHLRIPVTAQHQIVTIGTPLQNVQKKIVIDNIPCKDHPWKMACLFCRSCDSLICPVCASSSHKKHNFVAMESAIDEKLDYLRVIHDRIDANLEYCKSKILEIQDIKPQYNALFNESLTKIKEKEQELVDSIRKYSKSLQQKVANERSQVHKILSKVEQDIKETRHYLEDQRNETEAILTSNKGSLIFKANMTINDQKFDIPSYQVQQFIPGTEFTEKIPELFGLLGNLSIRTSALPGMNFELVRTFTTDLPFLSTLVTLDKTSAWINCYERQVTSKIHIQNNNMTTSKEIPMEVYDMAVTPKNELLLCIYYEPEIKLLKRSGEMMSFLSVSPLLLVGIHVTKDSDVIVGVKEVQEHGNAYTPTDKSQRAVMRFSKGGKLKHNYQYNSHRQRLFCIPSRITTNNNQDVLVVDRTSDKFGRVVVINKEGNLRWLYEGNSTINLHNKFDPRGIVTTTVGHIIVSDFSSHALHILSENGQILTCKDMSDMGILHPWGLAVDKRGRFWVGCGAEETGAKLHIIKLA